VRACGLMLRFVLACAVCLGVVGRSVAETSPAAKPPVPTPLNPDVQGLIDQLGSPNFGVRVAATEKLRTSTADRLRPALLDAAHHSPDPEIRQRAAKLLCDLNWSTADDARQIQLTLSDYRTPDPEKRTEVIARLGAMGAPAVPALLRLLGEEPSDDVRWAIVAAVRLIGDHATAQERELKAGADDAPALAAEGWGWQPSDPERAAPLLRRAADLATTQPVDDHGEVDTILQMLIARAINRAEYADAVELYRRHMWYSELTAEQEVQNLFALHAQYGPQPGFERDVRTYGAFFSQPEMMYVLGRIYAHQGAPLAAQACYAAAAAGSVGDPEAHLRVGEFLLGREWFDLARTELRRAIASAPRNVVNPRELAAAYYDLARCAEGMGNELQAAGDLEEAQKALRALPRNGTADEFVRLYESLADWHRLRDATQRNDHAEVARVADKLLNSAAWQFDKNASVDVDIDLTRALKSVGRKEDAAKVFGHAYPTLHDALDAHPHDAETLNNLAWLCARSGEHAAEAYAWANEATRLAPGNAAYLDTAAEASAGLGKWDEAVRRETLALQLQPGDRFMAGQLERFKAAAATQPAR
jgi:tetratricopeptide (TPR) repeat protein